MRLHIIGFFVAIVLAAFMPKQFEHPQTPKVKDLWDVKTLTDSAAKKINYVPKKASIMQLRALSSPPVYSAKRPREGAEFLTFKVKCKITSFTKDNDGDLRVVLTDLSDSTMTMVGEVPHIGFDSVMTQFNASKLPNVRYEVTGVLLFEKPNGYSPNGAELYPILGIKKM